MVTIKYYPDPTQEPEIHVYDSVLDFLLPRFETRDQLLDLRFFDGDLLCDEIDQTGGDFLEINKGTVAITHDSMIPRAAYAWYIVVAVIAAVAVVALTPRPEIPVTGRDQQSGTNSLGDSTNEPRINQRIDDVFGTVNKHVPSLWQVPYRIGIDNQETEVLLCCVGRGRYQIDPNNWYDGDTPVVNIPNAAVNIYEPYKNPNDDMPDTVIGYNITEKIGLYRQSNDLNPSELQPPNALENSGIVWELSGGAGSTAIMTAISIPEDFDFQDFYNTGELIVLNDMLYYPSNGTVTLDIKNDTGSETFNAYDSPVDLGFSGTLEYEIINVTTNTLTLTIPFDAPASVFNAWAAMTDYTVPLKLARVIAGIALDTYIIEGVALLNDNEWTYYDGANDVDVSVNYIDHFPSAGVYFNNEIGPVFSPDGATEGIFNFVSPNGFYKLVENTETRVIGDLEIVIYEVDNLGSETGLSTSFPVVYNTALQDRTRPKFQTERIVFPYTRNKIFVRRNGPRDKKENVSNVDVVEWRDLYTFEPVDNPRIASALSTVTIIGGEPLFDSISDQDLIDLGLSVGTDQAGELIRVTIDSVNVDEELEIVEVTTLGVNQNYIRFTTTPTGVFDSTTYNVDFNRGSEYNFGDATVAHVLIPSNSTSRLIKQRKQNVDLTRLVTQYLGNGNFGATESYATDQFDQILIHQSLDSRIGRLSLDNINADGYMDIRQEMINYFGSDEMCKFGYVFDTVSLTFQDIYTLVADAVMCRPYVQFGVYDLFFEKAQTVSTMQVTCRNKIFESEARRTIERKHDGVELTYRSNVTGAQETIYVPSDQSAANPLTLDVKGITDELQATRRANREYNKILYKLESVQFDVDEFGRNIVPYKRIDSPDSTRFTKRADTTDGYRVYDGEVIEVNGLQVELSEPVEFIDGEDHYITFTKANGDNSEIILCTQIDEHNVLLSTLPSESIYDGYQKDRTKFILVSEQLQDSVALIPETIEFRLDDNNVETHSVKLINYTDKYYQNDLDTLE